MITIVLVRHAQTPYNASRKYVGGRSSHLPLTSIGEEQGQLLAQWLNAKELTAYKKVFCSAAVRGQKTLELISNELIIEQGIAYSEQIEEMSHGKWEGLLVEDIYTPEQRAIINQNRYHFKAPDGESAMEVEERMYQYVEQQILSEFTEGNFLMVSHGNAIKCFMRRILQSAPERVFNLKIANTSMTKVSYEEQTGWIVDFINATPHL